jgi:hypothetical protein
LRRRQNAGSRSNGSKQRESSRLHGPLHSLHRERISGDRLYPHLAS